MEKGSTWNEPKILRVKVLRVHAADREVLLAHLCETEEGKYKLVVGMSTWIESFDALIFPIDTSYDAATHLYTLGTPKIDIHKAVKLN